MFPLYEAGSKAWWGWPVVVRNEGSAHVHFLPAAPDPSQQPPDLTSFCLFIRNLDDWEAQEFSWTSALANKARFPTETSLFDDAHCYPRAFTVGEVVTLLVLAAQNAFWQISMVFLRLLARHIHCDLSAVVGEFAVVFALVKFVLACTDAEALDICRMRLIHQRRETACDDLLASEDALEVLSKPDAQQALSKNRDLRQRRAAMKEYRTSMKGKRRELAAAGGPGRGGRGRGRKGGKGRGADGPPRINVLLHGRVYPRALPRATLTQAQVKPLMPPGTYVWRGNSDGTWRAHFPRARRYFTKPWTKYGPTRSAFELLVDVWACWLEFYELELSDCPIANLFPQPAGADKGKGKGGKV